MGAYSLDRLTSSPKKSALPRGSGFLEVRRRLSSRRYFCIWIMMALIPCYLLRQMFSYQSPPSGAAYVRHPDIPKLDTTTKTVTTAATIPSEKKPNAVQENAASGRGVDEADERPTGGGQRSRAEADADKWDDSDTHEKRAAQARKPKKKKKSVLDFLFHPNTIKPAQYKEGHATGNKGQAGLPTNSLKLKLKENFEDDEDFGVAEDNDKAEEQSWTAPPAPSEPKDKTLLGRR